MNMQDTLLPLQVSFAREFAQDWVDAWNGHDLERILSHYDDEVLLTSPVALKLLNLIDVLWGTETIVIYYINNVRGSKTAEVMLLNPAGKIRCVWANYDQ